MYLSRYTLLLIAPIVFTVAEVIEDVTKLTEHIHNLVNKPPDTQLCTLASFHQDIVTMVDSVPACSWTYLHNDIVTMVDSVNFLLQTITGMDAWAKVKRQDDPDQVGIDISPEWKEIWKQRPYSQIADHVSYRIDMVVNKKFDPTPPEVQFLIVYREVITNLLMGNFPAAKSLLPVGGDPVTTTSTNTEYDATTVSGQEYS